MTQNKLGAIAIFSLAICILMGSIWIGYSIQKLDLRENNTQYEAASEKGLISQSEAAQYLGLTEQELEDIMIKNEEDKLGLTVYSTYRFLPYLKLDTGKVLFNRKELDKWIEFNMNIE